MIKTVQKRVSRHVEHLRLLHMPVFAFLKHYSKIDDEITLKTRFFGMLNIFDSCICLYLRFWSIFQKLIMKSTQKCVFSACWTFAKTAYEFICVSRVDFKTYRWKQSRKRVFWHVEPLRLLRMPLFAFLKRFSKIHDEITAKTRFSACRVCANTVYAYICVSRKDFKSWW